jgi:hypothetical protein
MMFLLATGQNSIFLVIFLMPQKPMRVIQMHYGILIDKTE